MTKTQEKVRDALALQRTISQLKKELDKAQKEYNEIMSDPYIYDKVHGLKQGGIV